MKNNWKAMVAGLAVLIGLSGAAFGADRDHDRARVDRDHVRVEQRAWNHDRDWNRYRDERRIPERVYRGPVYTAPVYRAPYYGPTYTTPYYGPAYTTPYYGYYGGNYGYYGPAAYSGNAEQIGFQDGLRDGRNDRMTGHSFRPTHDDNYHNADRGYSGAFGGKQAYKDTYRMGYERGYQEGYGR